MGPVLARWPQNLMASLSTRSATEAALLVHPPRNKNIQKNDSDRQQHPVLERDDAQNHELSDEPIPHEHPAQKAMKKLCRWMDAIASD